MSKHASSHKLLDGDVRAAIEVKGTTPELVSIIESEQVGRYLSHHAILAANAALWPV